MPGFKNFTMQPRFVRFMTRLSRDLRVVHMDKRGMGMSDRIFGTPDVSLLMDDVRAVMDASGTERAAVLGWTGDPLKQPPRAVLASARAVKKQLAKEAA